MTPGCVVVECASTLVYVRSAVSVKLLPFVNPPPPSSSCCSRADVSLNEQMSDWSSLLHYCWNDFSCVVKCSRDEKSRCTCVLIEKITLKKHKNDDSNVKKGVLYIDCFVWILRFSTELTIKSKLDQQKCILC